MRVNHDEYKSIFSKQKLLITWIGKHPFMPQEMQMDHLPKMREILVTCSRDDSLCCVKFVSLLFREMKLKGMVIDMMLEQPSQKSFWHLFPVPSYNNVKMAKFLVNFQQILRKQSCFPHFNKKLSFDLENKQRNAPPTTIIKGINTANLL